MTMSRLARVVILAAVAAGAVLSAALPGPARAQESVPTGWLAVDYAPLIDPRQLTHSGETLGSLLRRLDGRGLPEGDERPADRLAHTLIDPWLEPYAFVIADALDALRPPVKPWIEIGSLYPPGGKEPAWVELLRSRHYLVHSDGAGRLRVVAPWGGNAAFAPGGAPLQGDAAAGEAAWRRAWPVLRHVLAAERARLARDGEPEALEVQVHAYRHLPERLRFLFTARPHVARVSRTDWPDGPPPLDSRALTDFFARGRILEGARLEPGGEIRLLTRDEATAPATILGAPIGVSDLAVAYRAVFHGGLAEPYMSLDVGYSPQSSVVNYGGRLRDTRLGWVSLLCDIRFKTFSMGHGILEGRDLQQGLRALLPEFRTHLERFAADPRAGGVQSQQTRLWFYPDTVDLTVSPQADVLVLRRVRMAAASERVVTGSSLAAGGEDPPWTRATIDAINADYDRLAQRFGELGDLDQAVRLLSFFTWLRLAEMQGLDVPDLAGLLAVELPHAPTPRRFPQMLSFNALPPAGETGTVLTFERVPVAEALERLKPSTGRPLASRLRFDRAMSALNPTVPQQAALLEEVRGRAASAASDVEFLDAYSYRAERLRMHHTVLSTLTGDERKSLADRPKGPAPPRIFSLGIGGIDLGLQRALGKALGQAGNTSLGLGGVRTRRVAGASSPAPRVATPVTRSGDRDEPVAAPLPEHGGGTATAGHSVVRAEGEAPRGWTEIYNAEGVEARYRRVTFREPGKPPVFERFEAGRSLGYSLRAVPAGFEIDTAPPRIELDLDAAFALDAAPGVVVLDLLGRVPGGAEAKRRMTLRSVVGGVEQSLETEYPRRILQRVVMGREVLPPTERVLPGFEPLPERLGAVETLLVAGDAVLRKPPWQVDSPTRAGDADPLRIAAGLSRWFDGSDASNHPVVLGVDPAASVPRLLAAPPLDRKTTLILPEDGFPPPFESLRERIGSAWTAGDVVGDAGGITGSLVVLVSAEGPDTFGRRVRALAADPRMKGRALAVWCLAGTPRQDLPAAALADGRLAGFGFAEASVTGLREAADRLGAYADRLRRGKGRRPHEIVGPFLWIY